MSDRSSTVLKAPSLFSQVVPSPFRKGKSGGTSLAQGLKEAVLGPLTRDRGSHWSQGSSQDDHLPVPPPSRPAAPVSDAYGQAYPARELPGNWEGDRGWEGDAIARGQGIVGGRHRRNMALVGIGSDSAGRVPDAPPRRAHTPTSHDTPADAGGEGEEGGDGREDERLWNRQRQGYDVPVGSAAVSRRAERPLPVRGARGGDGGSVTHSDTGFSDARSAAMDAGEAWEQEQLPTRPKDRGRGRDGRPPSLQGRQPSKREAPEAAPTTAASATIIADLQAALAQSAQAIGDKARAAEALQLRVAALEGELKAANDSREAALATLYGRLSTMEEVLRSAKAKGGLIDVWLGSREDGLRKGVEAALDTRLREASRELQHEWRRRKEALGARLAALELKVRAVEAASLPEVLSRAAASLLAFAWSGGLFVFNACRCKYACGLLPCWRERGRRGRCFFTSCCPCGDAWWAVPVGGEGQEGGGGGEDGPERAGGEQGQGEQLKGPKAARKAIAHRQRQALGGIGEGGTPTPIGWIEDIPGPVRQGPARTAMGGMLGPAMHYGMKGEEQSQYEGDEQGEAGEGGSSLAAYEPERSPRFRHR